MSITPKNSIRFISLCLNPLFAKTSQGVSSTNQYTTTFRYKQFPVFELIFTI